MTIFLYWNPLGGDDIYTTSMDMGGGTSGGRDSGDGLLGGGDGVVEDLVF